MKLIILLVATIYLTTSLITVKAVKELPPYFPVCSRNDPNLGKCLVKAAETMRPYLKKGIPELNLPPLSPFLIPEVVIEQGTEVVNSKAKLSNVELIGLDNYNVRKFEFDPKALFFYADLDMGYQELRGDFEIKGKILTVPIDGKGKVFGSLLNSNGTLEQKVKIVTKKGRQFLEPTHTNISIKYGPIGDYKIDSFFGGGETIEKAVMKVIDDNAKVLLEEVRPAVEKVIEKILVDVLLKGIYRVPYDKLYPEKYEAN